MLCRILIRLVGFPGCIAGLLVNYCGLVPKVCAKSTTPLLLFQYILFYIYGNARCHSVFIPRWVVRCLFLARYKECYLSMPLSIKANSPEGDEERPWEMDL